MSVANDGIWDWNILEKKLFFDPRYYTMAGYSVNSFPMKSSEWEKRVHPEDLQAVKRRVDDYISGNKPVYDIEFRFLKADKTYMWIRSKAKIVSWDVNGKPLRLVGTHSDITEQKISELELESNRSNIKAIIENTKNMIWSIDKEYNLLTCNSIFIDYIKENIPYKAPARR